MTDVAAPPPETPENAPRNQAPAANGERHWTDYAAVWAAAAAAIAAACAAGVGAWQGLIASDTEKRQLRAYVGVVVPDNGPIQQLGSSPVIKLKIRNFGTTPAYKMTYEAGIGDEPYPLPRDFQFQPDKSYSSDNPVTVWPGPLDPEGIIFIPSQDQLSQASDGGTTTRLYMWGTIRYSDVFGGEPFTDFCISEFKTDKGWFFERCAQHNDSN